MERRGHRYPLVIYTLILDRWWKRVFWIGIFLLLVPTALQFIPQYFPAYQLPQLSASGFWTLGGVGAFSILMAGVLASIRRSAYIQPLETCLRLSTPFLRLNISYRRIRQASSLGMHQLFPLEHVKGWKRSFIKPMLSKTAVIVDMNAYPLSPSILKCFLSPFFFPDKTPRMVFLIPRWVEFSTELESLRGAWLEHSRHGNEKTTPAFFHYAG